jgi:PAS domain S-box-containing protein
VEHSPASVDSLDLASALRASERALQELFARTPAPMWIIDAESLRILAVNDAAVERYGWSRDEFLQRSLRDLWPDHDRAGLWRARQALLAGHDVHGVFRHWSRTRELFDVELRTTPLSDGPATLRLALAFDITEHKRAADASSYLDRASSLFGASLDVTQACRTLALLAAARVCDWAAVYTVDDRHHATLAGFAHANPLDEPVVEGMLRDREVNGAGHPVQMALATGRAVRFTNGASPLAHHLPGTTVDASADWRLGMRAAAWIPVRGRGRTLAVLECVAVSEGPERAVNVPLAEALAARAALALDNALLYEEARQAALPGPAVHAQFLPVQPAMEGGAGAEAPVAALLEHVTDGFFAVDRDWRITFANHMAERILRRPRDEFLGRVFWEVFPNTAGTPFEREYLRAAREQCMVEFEAYYAELASWYFVRASPAPAGLGIFFRDTTPWRRAEADRHDSERVLYEYVELASDLIHLLSPDGRTLFANRAWRETLGYDQEELRRLTMYDIIAPEYHELASAELARVLSGAQVADMELEVVAKDGRRVRVVGGGGCRFADGRPVAIIGIFRNVTALVEETEAVARARLAAAAADRTRAEFLGQVNQELRTPLTSIIGFSELLEHDLNGTLAAADRDFARRISRQGRQLLAVIEDLLAYAEIEGQRVALRVAPVDVRDVVNGVLGEMAPAAALRQLVLGADIPGAPVPLPTDPERLGQLLRYLLADAVRSAPGGRIDGGVLPAADGQPPAVLLRHRGTSESGLALTIARSLSHLLGFTLGVEHAEGATTITLGLETVAAADPGASRGGMAPASLERRASHVDDGELASLLHAVATATPLALLVYDTDWTVRLWNAAAERTFGWSAAEVVGRRLPNIPDEELDRQRELLHRVVQSGAVVEAPARRCRRDGSWLEVHASIAPLHDAHGRLLGFVSLLADVTEKVRLEAQLRQAQKMEVVGQLAGGIAHDFNNLLTVIDANASFLLEEIAADDPRRGDAMEIRHAARRAAALTRQLLIFARKQAPERQVIDLCSIVRETERMLRRLLTPTIELAAICAEHPCEVFADPAQVEQLVMNLALNARDAMPDGGTLVIETHAEKVGPGGLTAPVGDGGWGGDIPPGAYSVLTVRDSGVGMDAATRARIFEPFFTTKGPGKGTGLGLATVQAIVADAAGFIRVESAPGRGTTFRIFLPVAEGAAGAVAGEGDVVARGHETVLLVEDQTGVRDVASRILRRYGYKVLTARHGSDALEVLAGSGERVALLITDVVMTEMGGYELATRARALRPGLPIVFMSGYSEISTGEHPIPRGEVPSGPTVQKPFTANELAGAVRQALDARDPAR